MDLRKVIIRSVQSALILFAIPIALLAFLGLSVAAVPVLIYFQLLLIEIQLEIGQRQNNLFSAQFYPSFTVEISNPATYELKIKNISRNPAYTLFIGRVLKGGQPLPHAQWESLVETIPVITSLAPGEAKTINPFKSMEAVDKFKKDGLALEVTYRDQFGDIKGVLILAVGDSGLLLFPNAEDKPGFLLKKLETMAAIWKLRQYKRRIVDAKTESDGSEIWG